MTSEEQAKEVRARALDKEFFENIRAEFSASIDELIRYYLGDADTVFNIREREFNTNYRKMQLRNLISKQCASIVCPFCNNKNSVGTITETRCCGHGDYMGVVHATCGVCGATMTVAGTGLEGELLSLLKWKNPTLSPKELDYAFDKLLRQNLITSKEDSNASS